MFPPVSGFARLMKSSILLIGNPAARRAAFQKFEFASAFLRERGFDTKVLLTEKSGDATLLARDAARTNPYAIMAAGGDGTINEVINGMATSGVPLAILPLGTTNVLAKELGIPEDLGGALEALVSQRLKTISLGKIELDPDSGSGQSRYFCLMAGIGFDAQSVHDINPSVKKISGKAAYLWSGTQNILHYAPNHLFYTIDGKEYEGYASITSKAARYGGNFRIAPEADLAEPALYTFIFQGSRRRDLLRYVYRVVTGTLREDRDIVHLKSTSIDILGTAHIQIDGDYLGTTPARITVEKDVLQIMY